MKKLILTGLLAVSTLLQADSYLLTMSKDDKVCQHMGEIFNWDLIDEGKILFEDHEEFNWIKWDKTKVDFLEAFGSYRGDYFDINNDGKKEVVAFSKKRFDLKWDEDIYYFSIELKNKMDGKKALPWRKINKDNLYLGRTLSSYKLNNYPIQKKHINANNSCSDPSYALLVKPYIRPLKINEKYFIALIGNVGINTLRSDTLEEKNSIVIQKFTPENIAEDICYFVKVTQINKEGKK